MLPTCENPALCSGTVLHAYKDKNLAFLLNPIHADIKNPLIFSAEGDVVVDNWDKVGCFELTTLKQLLFPKWVGSDRDHRVRVMFAVLCAEAVLSVYEDKYPNDNRLRKAVEAAKNFALDPSDENQKLAAEAAEVVDAAAEAAARAARAAEAAEAAEGSMGSSKGSSMGSSRGSRAAAEAAWAAAEAARAAGQQRQHGQQQRQHGQQR